MTHEDSTLEVVQWDVLLGVRWYDIPQAASLLRFRDLQSQYLARLAPRKAIVVSVSHAIGDLRFDPGSRELVETVMADAQTHLLGMAQVISGDGFAAASVRSVLLGIQLTVRPDYRVRVFADVHEARPWLEDLLVAADADDLARDLTEILARLDAPRAISA